MKPTTKKRTRKKGAMSRAVHSAARLARRERSSASISVNSYTLYGTGVSGHGVFKDKSGVTYAGQIRDGHACGLGVLDIVDGHKIYAEYGPYGENDGRHLDRDAGAGYILFERGRHKEEGWVVDARFGECEYNHEECARNDPRLLALIARIDPVEALANAAAKEAKEAVAAIRRSRRVKSPSANLALSSIRIEECNFNGISVVGRGVFTDMKGRRYAGQCKGGYARGLGVLTARDGTKSYSEYGPNGELHCRSLARYRSGGTSYLLVHGDKKHRLVVFAEGSCTYNMASCAPDDPGVLALIGHVAPIEALASAAAKEAEEAVEALPRRVAGLELMLTVMLARYREQTVVSELATELLTLPSGVLAIVCAAMVNCL